MKESRDPTFSIEEVAEALDGVIAPEIVIDSLKRYIEMKHMSEAELARMEHMIAIVDEYDEIVQFDNERGSMMYPDRILNAASDYLHHTHGQVSVDELDQNTRYAATYILKVLGLAGELPAELQKEQLLFDEIKHELLQQGFVLKLTNEDNVRDVPTN
jgi:hypothetical protein